MNRFLKRLLYLDFFRSKLINIELRKNDIFQTIGIETSSECNRKCSYCPNSNIGRPQGIMAESLFYKIIDELSNIKYSGTISPGFYNEVLLDHRMLDFTKYIREKVPKSKIIFYTNGDFLSYELLHKFINAGVNIFRIAEHSKQPGQIIQNTLAKVRLDGRFIEKHIDYVKFYGHSELLMNRGGLVNRVENTNISPWCDYVNTYMNIDWQGNVVLCCNDYLSSYVLGDVNNESLIDIWNKPANKVLRTKISCGIFEYDICKKCKQKSRTKH